MYADEQLLLPLVSVVRSHQTPVHIHVYTATYVRNTWMWPHEWRELLYTADAPPAIVAAAAAPACYCRRCFNDVDYFWIELVVAILISYEHDTHVNRFIAKAHIKYLKSKRIDGFSIPDILYSICWVWSEGQNNVKWNTLCIWCLNFRNFDVDNHGNWRRRVVSFSLPIDRIGVEPFAKLKFRNDHNFETWKSH